ncbi:hypothetical protein [Limnohabitans sp.]|uniref:hypothetical protein n=1 Tax=Limnohabitans sp. TaxID=1907725 RepID=UPI00286F28EB|nr:hypothetical protein [Limnohabitans sp.]
MHNRNQLIHSLKSIAQADNSCPEKSYCQRLNYHAQRVGFQNFEHYRRWLKSAPEASLGNISTRLLERTCATKLPTINAPYVELTPLPNGFSFYSHWIGWDRHGNEVREPRPLDAQHSVPKLRRLLNYPIYVVETLNEMLAWQYTWKSTAYLPEDMVRKYFPSLFAKKRLIDPNVSTELIRQQAAKNNKAI